MGAPLGLTLLDLPALQDIVTTPSYTDIFNETMGTAATDQDGFPESLANVAALVDAFAAEVDATSAAIDIPGIIAGGTGIDVAPLDTTIEAYTGTIPAGQQHVADALALAPPELLELPMSPSFGLGAGAPPAQKSVDLGTVKVGSATFLHLLGAFNQTKLSTTGLLSAMLVNGDPRIFGVVEADRQFSETHIRGTYTLQVTPVAVGTWVAQVNTYWVSQGVDTILTFTLTVTP